MNFCNEFLYFCKVEQLPAIFGSYSPPFRSPVKVFQKAWDLPVWLLTQKDIQNPSVYATTIHEIQRTLPICYFTTQQLYNSNSSDRIWTRCRNDGGKQPSQVCENLYSHQNYLPVTAVVCKRVWTQCSPKWDPAHLSVPVDAAWHLYRCVYNRPSRHRFWNKTKRKRKLRKYFVRVSSCALLWRFM